MSFPKAMMRTKFGALVEDIYNFLMDEMFHRVDYDAAQHVLSTVKSSSTGFHRIRCVLHLACMYS